MRIGQASASPHLHYQPALDGIRAVAVVSVLLYHADVAIAGGGFLGVDLFFALSGYLVTTLLLREHANHGGIAVPAFWARRLRRLLPALLLVLVAVAAYAALAVEASSLPSLRGDLLASLFYVQNWHLIFSDQSYFAAFADPSPLRHVWSLAIEEQWYLLWPLALSGMLRLTGGRSDVWTPVVALAAVGSAVLMAVWFDPIGDPSRVYYGTDTRAQTLLAGAALALLLHNREVSPSIRRSAGILGVQGLVAVLVVVAFAADDDEWLYRGGFLAVALAGCLLVAGSVLDPQRWVGRLLSSEPLPTIGRLSYGLYLWHWPVYVAVDADRLGTDGPALLAARLVLTAAVSVASYELVELPIRMGRLRKPPWSRVRPVVLTCGAIVVTAVLALAGTVGGDDDEVGAVVDRGEQGDLRVLLVGSSVGRELGKDLPSGLDGVALTNAAIAGCGIVPGTSIIPKGDTWASRRLANTIATRPGACEPLREEEWGRALREGAPDVVAIEWGSYEVFDLIVDGETLPWGSEAWDRHAIDALRATGERLGAGDTPVALLTVHCFEGGPVPQRDDPARIVHLNELAAEAVEGTDMTLVDLNGAVCPGGRHVAELDGVPLYRDSIHFTPEGAAAVWRWLVPELRTLAGR